MEEKFYSKSNEYIKRYGQRYCYEWFMRSSIDRCYRVLLRKIKSVRTKERKHMAILMAESMAVNLIISCLFRKWK